MSHPAIYARDIGTIRNTTCYGVNTQISVGDSYYEDITDGALIDYNNRYAGVGFFYVPASTGPYAAHAMLQSRTTNAPILALEISANNTAFILNIIRGTVRGGNNVDFRYTDNRSFPTNAWYKIGWWYTTSSSTGGPSQFWVNNVSAPILNVPTTSSPHPVGSQLIFSNNTPVGFKLGSLIVSVDNSLTYTDAQALQILGGVKTPFYIGTGSRTNTGKIKTVYIDNGPSVPVNQVTGTTFTHAFSGTVPTPISHQQAHIIIP
jgi:hypothetical protein